MILCKSGGAAGADLVWGNATKFAGGAVDHLSFFGHQTRCNPLDRIVLDQATLNEADPHVVRASRALGRRTFFLPETSLNTKNLLRRNYYQTVDSRSLYGAGELKNGDVAGGTGYAVEMFRAREKHKFSPDPMYFYDQLTGQWLYWNYAWARWVERTRPPKPEGVFTGVGTRKLRKNAEEAIWKVFG